MNSKNDVDVLNKFIYLFNSASWVPITAIISNMDKIIKNNVMFDVELVDHIIKNNIKVAMLEGFQVISEIISYLRLCNMYAFIKYLIKTHCIFPCPIYFWYNVYTLEKNSIDILNSIIWSSDNNYGTIARRSWSRGLIIAITSYNIDINLILPELHKYQIKDLLAGLYIEDLHSNLSQERHRAIIEQLQTALRFFKSKRYLWITSCITL
jgi:hypothetical protein